MARMTQDEIDGRAQYLSRRECEETGDREDMMMSPQEHNAFLKAAYEKDVREERERVWAESVRSALIESRRTGKPVILDLDTDYQRGWREGYDRGFLVASIVWVACSLGLFLAWRALA